MPPEIPHIAITPALVRYGTITLSYPRNDNKASPPQPALPDQEIWAKPPTDSPTKNFIYPQLELRKIFRKILFILSLVFFLTCLKLVIVLNFLN